MDRVKFSNLIRQEIEGRRNHVEFFCFGKHAQMYEIPFKTEEYT